jgi:hypothetical protein
MAKIIGYFWDADFHCAPHTEEKYTTVETENCVDGEGNPIYATFESDEVWYWLKKATGASCPEDVCGDCVEEKIHKGLLKNS